MKLLKYPVIYLEAIYPKIYTLRKKIIRVHKMSLLFLCCNTLDNLLEKLTMLAMKRFWLHMNEVKCPCKTQVLRNCFAWSFTSTA